MNDAITKNKKTASILGCGWYGLELAKALVNEGYQVNGSSTSPEKLEILSAFKIQPFLIDIQKDAAQYDPAFFETDLLFICIPPKRNTTEQADFYHKIERIAEAAKKHQIKQLVLISSTAVYGDSNSILTESDVPQPETASGKAMLKAEMMLKSQQEFKTTVIRFAGLVGPNRHPGRFFAGKRDVPNGKAPINLIHLEDCIGISLAILKYELFGHTINACAPHHPQKQEFYTLAATNAGLEPPIFRNELLNWKIINSNYNTALNYNYLVTNWTNFKI